MQPTDTHSLNKHALQVIKKKKKTSSKWKQMKFLHGREWSEFRMKYWLKPHDGDCGRAHQDHFIHQGLSELPTGSTRQRHIIKDGEYLFTHNSRYLELLNPQPSLRSTCDLGRLPAAGININYCCYKIYLGTAGRKKILPGIILVANHGFLNNLIRLNVVNGCL